MNFDARYKRELPQPHDPHADKDPRFAGQVTAGGQQSDEYSRLWTDIVECYDAKVFMLYKGVPISYTVIQHAWGAKMGKEIIFSRQRFAEQFWEVMEEQSKIDQTRFWDSVYRR